MLFYVFYLIILSHLALSNFRGKFLIETRNLQIISHHIHVTAFNSYHCMWNSLVLYSIILIFSVGHYNFSVSYAKSDCSHWVQMKINCIINTFVINTVLTAVCCCLCQFRKYMHPFCCLIFLSHIAWKIRNVLVFF